eukprot:TRINITY_DN68497_c0_g1_i1.p1 TRINITY_DN68497_c0_g1~~TRINITY_DN68497_c0_g1_i1.p1  ORF type:complete len:657 (-),score=142.70 TRINITY_DN68497_c0_g1_i1:70-2040(-)
MDPYKLLGVDQSSVKVPSDLPKVRQRAKKLYKRFASEKKKFDAKKVLEAFDQIKQRLKGRMGEGANKHLGRSRMERMMDKHYNHQTKEIKKDKKLRKALKKARKGEARLHLPGDKERIPTGRGRRHHRRSKRRRQSSTIQKKQVQALEGLQRLASVLPHKSKFPKAIKLFHRWMKEHMNNENREFVFEVLQEIVEADFLLEDTEARQDVTVVFEYVLSYYSNWFEEAEAHRTLNSYWRVSTVLACRCFTDDAFTLSSTLTKLGEALTMLESNREVLGEGVRYEDDHAKVPAPERKRSRLTSPFEDGFCGMSPSPLATPWPYASPGSDAEDDSEHASSTNGDVAVKREVQVKDEEAKIKAEEVAEAKLKIEAAEAVEARVKVEVDVKAEDVNVKAEDDAENDECVPGPTPSPSSALTVLGLSPASPFPEPSIPKVSPSTACPSPGPLPIPSPAPPSSAVELLSDDDSSDQVCFSGVKKEAIDVGSEEESIKEEISDSSSEDDSDSEECAWIEDVEDVGSESSEGDIEMNVFPVPQPAESLYRLRVHFVERCLNKLFQNRGPLWARSKIDNFFQDLFYRRAVFGKEQRQRIEAWQSRIKTMQKNAERDVGTANNPMEAQRPIIDSREERVVLDADSNVWSAKQTFDSRERTGGRNVIR